MASERVLKVKILGDSRSAQSALQRLSGGMGSFARHAGVAIAATAAAVGTLGVKAVNDAANLGESINKANVVFGKNRRAVLGWSQDTADSIGVTRAAALEAASGFGLMLDTAGIAPSKLAPMSKSMVQLASDMGSFNNVDPAEMLEKLRSGLSGEAEPLRKYGVFISEAAVAEQAFKDGIAKRGEALTDAQKVQARYNLILEQTGKQQGDFAKTSDSMPNQMRRLKAAYTDVSAELGTKLLPIATKVLSWLNDHLPAAIAFIAPKLQALGEFFTEAFATVKEVFESIRGPVQNAGETVGGFADKAKALYKKAAPVLDDLRETFAAAFDFIKVVIQTTVKVVQALWQRFGKQLMTHAETAWNAIKQTFSGALEVIRGIFDVFAGIFTGDWSRVWDGIKQIVSGVWDVIVGVVKTAINAVSTAVGLGMAVISQIWSGAWRAIKSVLVGVWEGIKSAVASAVEYVLGQLDRLLGPLDEIAGKIASVGNIGSGIGDAVKGAVKAVIPGGHLLPSLAEGGSVGNLSAAAMPSPRFRMEGSSTSNVTINVNGGNIAEVEKVVMRQMEYARRRDARHDRTRGVA